jgi:SAM-dependent methyltransferase
VPGTQSGEDRAPVLTLDGGLEQPLLGHNELLVSGQVSAPGGVAALSVRFERESHPLAPRAGRFELSLDTSTWARGQHPFTVEAHGVDGALTALSAVAQVQPYRPPPADEATILEAVGTGLAAMWCEVPALDGGLLDAEAAELRGWAVSPAGIDRILVDVDGARRLTALHGLPRSDLRWCFGDELAASSGFALRLDPEELAPGLHRLTVIAVDAAGDALGMSGTVEVEPRAERKPRGGERAGIEPLPPQRLPRPAPPDRPGAAGSLDAALRPYAGYSLLAALGVGGRALDLGCENGWGTALLAGRMEGAVGVELSPLAVAEAARRWTGAASFEVAAFDDLPFADDSFDLVVSFSALQHAGQPERALEEMGRVLRPGGVLALGLGACDGDPRPAPFRRQALDPARLRELLAASFSEVVALEPRTFLASVLRGGDDGPRLAEELGAAGSDAPGAGDGLLLAGDGPLPEPPATVLLDAAAIEDDRRRLTELWRERSVLGEVKMATLRTETHYVFSGQRQTIERGLARALAAEDELAAARSELERLRTEYGLILGSRSWRLAQPLRAAGARLRRPRRRRG